MDNRESLFKVLRKDSHTSTYKNFIDLFQETIEYNHNKMDSTDLETFPKLQGINNELKRFIKNLT